VGLDFGQGAFGMAHLAHVAESGEAVADAAGQGVAFGGGDDGGGLAEAEEDLAQEAAGFMGEGEVQGWGRMSPSGAGGL